MRWKGKKLVLEYKTSLEECSDEDSRRVAKNGSIYYMSNEYIDIIRVHSLELSLQEKEEVMQLVKEGVEASRRDTLPSITTYSISARFINTRWDITQRAEGFRMDWVYKPPQLTLRRKLSSSLSLLKWKIGFFGKRAIKRFLSR